MRVFKFGGASIANADKIKHISDILKKYKTSKLVLVVSALGKTTNLLEKIVASHYYKENGLQESVNTLKNNHFDIVNNLFEKGHSIYDELNDQFVELEWFLEDEPQPNYDYCYDQIVSIGELLSSKIVYHYLKDSGAKIIWKDARDIIQTDNNYRTANVDWEKTEQLSEIHLQTSLNKEHWVLTQGYIASSSENFNTTLGREGSDYSGAIFSFVLNAESLTVWKDVPGIMTADPKKFKGSTFLESISYDEMIEMADAGAKVIHPKTLRPLQNKSIPLYVKSFIRPNEDGTKVSSLERLSYPPLMMLKENQVFLTLSPKSFKEQATLIFILMQFDLFKIDINYMQKSAINIHLCVDQSVHLKKVVDKLSELFTIKFEEGVEILSIRHSTDDSMRKAIGNRSKILEQKTERLHKVILKSTEKI